MNHSTLPSKTPINIEKTRGVENHPILSSLGGTKNVPPDSLAVKIVMQLSPA